MFHIGSTEKIVTPTCGSRASGCDDCDMVTSPPVTILPPGSGMLAGAALGPSQPVSAAAADSAHTATSVGTTSLKERVRDTIWRGSPRTCHSGRGRYQRLRAVEVILAQLVQQLRIF